MSLEKYMWWRIIYLIGKYTVLLVVLDLLAVVALYIVAGNTRSLIPCSSIVVPREGEFPKNNRSIGPGVLVCCLYA